MEFLAVGPLGRLALHLAVLLFSLLLGIAFPVALLSAVIVARTVRFPPRSMPAQEREAAVRARGELMLGGGWGCFGASIGVAIGALLLLVEGHPTAAFVGAALGLWFGAAGLALAIAGHRRLQRPDRYVVVPPSEMPTIGASNQLYC